MGILDLVFPKTCLNCGKNDIYICDQCLSKVRVLRQACPYCEKSSIDGFTHAKCFRKNGLDGLTSVWDYEGVIRKAILALKYKYSTQVGDELSRSFIGFLKSRKYIFPTSSVLVPIPLFWHRENVRGFNQSVEIGKVLATEMDLKFEPTLLEKNKPTSSQAQLSVEERKQNLKNVFTLNTKMVIPDSVILFDDVFTTGTTLKEAALVFKKGGVKKVWGLTIAR